MSWAVVKPLVGLGTIAAVATLASAGAAHAASCSRYASNAGSDRASGTAAHPFRSAQKLVRSLRNGATGCLAGGSTFRGRVVIDHPLLLRGDGRGLPLIVGGITISNRAQGAIVQDVAVRGTGPGRAAVLVNADGAHLVGSTISGTGFRDRNTACVLIAGSRRAVVDGNKIESCTLATKRGLSAPGVFVGSAYKAVVTNNLIVHTAGVGIFLGPNAQRTRVAHNLVDGTVGGVLITGNARTASSYNVVSNNILSNSGGNNVEATWPGAVGHGNAVVANCLWQGFAGNINAPGVRIEGNIVTNPRYVDRPRDYTLSAPACIAKRPRIVLARVEALAPFRVAFHVRVLPKRVQIVTLQLTGLQPGVEISARCVRGCSARWDGRARRSAIALPLVNGRWLPVGAVIEIRASKTAHAGAWARVSVVGLPNGLSVTHACLKPGGTSPLSCAGFA
jgi:Right handed beta helix region